MSSVITYPSPPYTNLPINAQYYKPSRFVISNVVRGQNTTVTTSQDHDYVVGNRCRLSIPNGYGCVQLSGKSGYIISVLSTTQVVLDIYSLDSNAFISASLSQQPQIIGIGDINSGAINGNGSMDISNSIPGAFINISPN